MLHNWTDTINLHIIDLYKIQLTYCLLDESEGSRDNVDDNGTTERTVVTCSEGEICRAEHKHLGEITHLDQLLLSHQ